ncbi:MAG TPA: DNA-3-methyladenine glycosylase 2 family protein [Desulfosporosinus sp.]|nr:DNA-3-methyladenine glycosylase 2 family protein [Desulfosporosinus sp.]
MSIFKYGQKEIDYLKRKDKKLGAAIDRIGIIQREITPDPFTALLSSVVSQQISKKAAETVWKRLCMLLGDEIPESSNTEAGVNPGSIDPKSIDQVCLSEIKACGMSERKASYIKGVADAAILGIVDFENLHTLKDDEIITQLSSLHGVGAWTAEMLLIFSFNRPNVLSFKDLAICRGMMNLYGLKELPKDKFERYRKRYSPYGSVASLYLWALSV